VKLLDTIDTYYELVDKRIPAMAKRAEPEAQILIDGKPRAAAADLSGNQLGRSSSSSSARATLG
jgi:hypothetical protein